MPGFFLRSLEPTHYCMLGGLLQYIQNKSKSVAEHPHVCAWARFFLKQYHTSYIVGKPRKPRGSLGTRRPTPFSLQAKIGSYRFKREQPNIIHSIHNIPSIHFVAALYPCISTHSVRFIVLKCTANSSINFYFVLLLRRAVLLLVCFRHSAGGCGC